ncbi:MULTISPECIES: DsrE family protein [Sulfurimonas]|uniref:DsrE family protein n=1 Tax=Sulfurimonas TaxID=202746 RepID=UPI00165EFD3B|nr:DsrE family protein [Sulfurimonas indica]
MRIFTLFLLLFVTFAEAKEYKVVFDCSSNDANYLKSRMWLVGKTIDMIEEQGDSIKAALTIHGKCALIASENYDMLVEGEAVNAMKQAQEYLIELSKRKNIELVVCAMSLNANSIDKEDVLPFLKISKNSYIDTIAYQNDGYALMTFK